MPEIMGGPPALGGGNRLLPRDRNRRQTERSPIFRQMESGERPVCLQLFYISCHGHLAMTSVLRSSGNLGMLLRDEFLTPLRYYK
jgi:hypothetical protein